MFIIGLELNPSATVYAYLAPYVLQVLLSAAVLAGLLMRLLISFAAGGGHGGIGLGDVFDGRWRYN